MLISQLALVIVILALVTGVFAWMGARTVTEVTETKALATARTLAIDPDVRAAATQASAEHAEKPDEQLVTSMLAITDDLRDRSGISFAVITDDRGIRLTHPDRSKIGHRVSTSPEEALAGRENVSHESGTLGETVRAKVPIYSNEDGKTVVGEVSVGIFASVLDADVRRELILLGTVAVLALALGGVVSVMLGRRLRRETLGVGPEELAEMARDQGAVLHGLDDGVLGFDTNGKLTLSNSNAKELLRAASAKHVDHANGTVDANGGAASAGDSGRELVDASDDELVNVPDEITALMADAPADGALRRRVTIGDRILLATAVRVQRDGVSVGGVVTLRDETQMLTMARQLESVTAMARALRTQRHEFANRLHAVSGLLELGRTEQARGYLADVLDHGPLRYPVAHADRLTEPYLQAFLGAKGVEAAERGVLLKLGPETLVSGTVVEAGDVTTVLGNLVDNAVRAAVAGDVSPAWIEVEVLDDGTDLHLSVMDSGRGVADADALFERAAGGSDAGGGAASLPPDDAVDPDDPSRVHGLGFGLPLSRDIARRRGGDVWLGSPGGDGHGAVFCARLADAVQPPAPPERIDP